MPSSFRVAFALVVLLESRACFKVVFSSLWHFCAVLSEVFFWRAPEKFFLILWPGRAGLVAGVVLGVFLEDAGGFARNSALGVSHKLVAAPVAIEWCLLCG